MIPAEKQDAINQLKAHWLYNNSRTAVQLVDYIENSNMPMPTFHNDLWYWRELICTLFRKPKYWDEFEERLIEFCEKTIWLEANHHSAFQSRHWFMTSMVHSDISIQETITILSKYGFSEARIWLEIHDSISIHVNIPSKDDFILDNADRYLSTLIHNFCDSLNFINYLVKNDSKLMPKYIDKFIRGISNGIEFTSDIRYSKEDYFRANAEKHESYLVSLISFKSKKNRSSIALKLIDLVSSLYPDKYGKEISLCIKIQFDISIEVENEYDLEFDKLINLLFANDSFENAFTICYAYFIKSKNKNFENVRIWLRKLKYYQSKMTSDIVENLWLFARHADKQVRQLTAQHIAKTLGEAAIPEAEKMLLDKKSDVRLTGSLILSLIKTEKATAMLRGCIDGEMNDDVRNAMLEGVSTYLVENASIESVAEAVEAAQKRGKLAKPVLNWLVNYPQLNYKNSENALDSDTISFLFYRMSQAKDIRTDLEARPLLSLIDRETSAPFAKWLLDAYFQNGADAKFKWCLTLGAVLGGDAEIAFLQRNIVSFVENSRGKMAEYVVKALALQGSQRALRAVDFFSRKYKNKSIGKAALEAFDVAAEELNMTPYELADSVIPDFGFDGLFKEFEANKETYRAYIGNDFKLAFLDEDNKTLKALPKGTSAVLKEEFKEIGKEIRDIVKSQSSRLEQYLVIQRRWSVDKWQGFFLTNPVMFVYAVRLIWGAFDEKNQLIAVFRCQEDQSLTDKNGDDIDFLELKITENAQNTEGGNQSSIDNKKLSIGMIHPIGLDAETIGFWKNDLLDNDIQAIFPQLNRPVILLDSMDENVKMSDAFEGVEVGGYTFLSRMEKTGWVKGSIGDGGCILSYYKTFTEVGLVAIVLQTGGLSVGYYDVNAEIGKVMFVKKADIRFGNYAYDEPSKMNDPRLVRFGNVPPIVYSEVMADMAFFKENRVK